MHARGKAGRDPGNLRAAAAESENYGWLFLHIFCMLFSKIIYQFL